MAAAGVGTNEPPEEAGEESEALEAVKMLLELCADINTVDKNGDTALPARRIGRRGNAVILPCTHCSDDQRAGCWTGI
jgi:hypothetical protein